MTVSISPADFTWRLFGVTPEINAVDVVARRMSIVCMVNEKEIFPPRQYGDRFYMLGGSHQSQFRVLYIRFGCLFDTI